MAFRPNLSASAPHIGAQIAAVRKLIEPDDPRPLLNFGERVHSQLLDEQRHERERD